MTYFFDWDFDLDQETLDSAYRTFVTRVVERALNGQQLQVTGTVAQLGRSVRRELFRRALVLRPCLRASVSLQEDSDFTQAATKGCCTWPWIKAAADAESSLQEQVDAAVTKVLAVTNTAANRWQQHRPTMEMMKHLSLVYVHGLATLTMTHLDVLELLHLLGISPREVLSRLATGTPKCSDDEADSFMQRLLRRCSSLSGDVAQTLLSFRDVFRLLEALHITIGSFMKRLTNGVYEERFADAWLVSFGAPAAGSPTYMGWQICRELAAGFGGAVVYLAVNYLSGVRAALKWPVEGKEMDVLKGIRGSSAAAWYPTLHSTGYIQGQPFAVVDLLGKDLTKIFERLAFHSLQRRWCATRIMGRMVLRRLTALHESGFVHCDISPHNIMLGRCRVPGAAGFDVVPQLIDFGQARAIGAGLPQLGDGPTMEYSSIRSGDGEAPRPSDDLEALGWTMLAGLFGKLPWFPWLSVHYELSDREKQLCAKEVVQRVQSAKRRVLEDGWGVFGADFAHLADIPPALDAYLRTCRDFAPPAGHSYLQLHRSLSRLLGGNVSTAELEQAELDDLRQFRTFVLPLL